MFAVQITYPALMHSEYRGWGEAEWKRLEQGFFFFLFFFAAVGKVKQTEYLRLTSQRRRVSQHSPRILNAGPPTFN